MLLETSLGTAVHFNALGWGWNRREGRVTNTPFSSTGSALPQR